MVSGELAGRSVAAWARFGAPTGSERWEICLSVSTIRNISQFTPPQYRIFPNHCYEHIQLAQFMRYNFKIDSGYLNGKPTNNRSLQPPSLALRIRSRLYSSTSTPQTLSAYSCQSHAIANEANMSGQRMSDEHLAIKSEEIYLPSG
jgi:hypothetical protein